MYKTPIFFERNRVGRVYSGGKLFSGFFGDEAIDGFEPEEWIASNVKALNENSKSDYEGISKVKGTDIYFDELLKAHKEELLGKSGKLRILVKVLDSAIRLPAQAHPDKEFSKKHFNSSYGKTECWIILDTRKDAKIFFGFKPGVTKKEFLEAIDKSEHDKNVMENLMLDITPNENDVYLVPAKTVHAIGKGCLILEIQEPTDFTIQPEHFCGDYKLSENEMYLGLDKETAVDCFDFESAKDAKIQPNITKKVKGFIKESLISEKNTDCFIVNRIILNNKAYIPNITNSYAIYIVTDGNAVIKGKNYYKEIKKGDYFFMPNYAMKKFKIFGSAEIIECY